MFFSRYKKSSQIARAREIFALQLQILSANSETHMEVGGVHVRVGPTPRKRGRPCKSSALGAPLPPPEPPASAAAATTPASASTTAADRLALPGGWEAQLRPQDRKWVSGLFNRIKGGKNQEGVVILKADKADKLWHSPPEPRPVYTSMPSPDDFFRQKFFLWAPRKMWSYKFLCQEDACPRKGKELTSAGWSKSVREVTAVDSCYYLGSEVLECSGKERCPSRKQYATGSGIMDQLPHGLRAQFPAFLTAKYAVDNAIITMLRDPVSGNSMASMQRRLEEEHSNAYYKKVAYYMTHAKPFYELHVAQTEQKKKGLVKGAVQAAPKPAHPMNLVPSVDFFADLYVKDVTSRLESEILPALTSIGGGFMKIDSTKGVLKKLGGKARGSAAWVTNFGNEDGQLILSVVTSGEDYHYLRPACIGIIKRYALRCWEPVSVIWADRGCCREDGSTFYHELFKPSGLQLDGVVSEQDAEKWCSIQVRLDSWHWMCRFIEGVSSDAHPKYPLFMSRLACCIFDFEPTDLANLRAAVLNNMVQTTGSTAVKLQDLVDAAIQKKELERHVRRKTAPVDVAHERVEALIEACKGDQGLDLVGNFLFNDKMDAVWKKESRHLKCLQDPSQELYTVTHHVTKGGLKLPVYRCARGSSSLECCHRWMNATLCGRNYGYEVSKGYH